MIKVLAIDDEPLALLQLQRMIELTPYFSLAGACQSAFEAMKVMENEHIDAIFADINMPDLSGIDFVRSLQHSPIIVFTTAYSQYALDGYKVNATDYLLKPFGQSEFQRAAMKVKQQYELLTAAKSNVENDILFVKDGYNIARVSLSDVMYVESQSEYLKIYMADGTSHMVLMSIKRMSEILPADRFVRIHRSYIVNMGHAVEISRMRVRMNADTILPIGDSYKDEALRFINERMIGK